MEKIYLALYSALETYSNVHRGSGYFSQITTSLYEDARDVVLKYLKLQKNSYQVIFCSPQLAVKISNQLNETDFYVLSSSDYKLALGVSALAVKKQALKKVLPVYVGGGQAKLVANEWVIWAKAPDKFEAGTPAIINVIAFTKCLQQIAALGEKQFAESTGKADSLNELFDFNSHDTLEGQGALLALKDQLIGRNVKVPTHGDAINYIHLDNSASTLTFEPIWQTFKKALTADESLSKAIVDKTERICADFLNAPNTDYDIYFGSNTTEAINLLASSLESKNESEESIILSSSMEHSSNDLPWRNRANSRMLKLKVDNKGVINLQELETLLKNHNSESSSLQKKIKLVSISGASNVLGMYNDLSKISVLVHQYGAELHVDAAQLIAHRSIDMLATGIDYLVFSAHKVYAPFGVGVLLARKGKLKHSNELEQLKESAFNHAAGIAALGKALFLLGKIGMEHILKKEHELNHYLSKELGSIDGLNVYGFNDIDSEVFKNKLGVIVFEFKGKMPAITAKKLSYHGIGVRAGCHCAHLIIKQLLGISPGLEKFQRILQTIIPPLKFQGLVRVSLGLQNTHNDIDQLKEALLKIDAKTEASTNGFNLKQEIKEFIKKRKALVYDH